MNIWLDLIIHLINIMFYVSTESVRFVRTGKAEEKKTNDPIDPKTSWILKQIKPCFSSPLDQFSISLCGH